MSNSLLSLGLSLSMATVGLGAMPAHAQSNCANRDLVVERLQSRYSEQLTAGGLQATRMTTTVIEVWSSPETGTFTIMLTTPEGVSCILASGTNWFTDKVVPMAMGTPS